MNRQKKSKWRLRRPDGEFQRWGHGRPDAKEILEYDTEEEAKQTCNYLANDYAIVGLVPEMDKVEGLRVK